MTATLGATLVARLPETGSFLRLKERRDSPTLSVMIIAFVSFSVVGRVKTSKVAVELSILKRSEGCIHDFCTDEGF
jgi:hypothetical protein